MATRNAREVIEDAFHKIGMVSEDESLSAEQTARGLIVINDMMHGWESDGIQYQHTDLTITATVNVPDQLVWATQWLMAEALGEEYGKTFTDRQERYITRARQALQAAYYAVPPAQCDEGVINRGPLIGGVASITRL